MEPVDIDIVDQSDGGASIVEYLYSGDIKEQMGTLLLMPSERACLGAKMRLLKMGGGVSGNIMTPRRFAERAYDILAIPLPLIDLVSRETLVHEIMVSSDLPHLKGGSDVRRGLSRHMAREIGELITGGVDPRTLMDGDGRRVDLGRVYGAYLQRLDELDVCDHEQVPWKVLEALENGGKLPFSRIGTYMLGHVPNSFRRLLERVMEDASEVVVQEHAARMGAGGARLRFTIPERGAQERQTVHSDVTLPLVRGMTRWDEIEAVARLLKSRLSGGDLDPSEAALILPSRRSYDPFVKILFRRYGLPIDMGNDIYANSAPAVRCVTDLLRLPLDGFGRDDVLRVLSSPFLSTYLEERGAPPVTSLERITRDNYIMGGGRDPVGSWVDGLLAAGGDGGKSDAARWAGILQELFGKLRSISGGKRDAGARSSEILSFIEYLGLEGGGAIAPPADPEDPERIDVKRSVDVLIGSLARIRRRAYLLGTGKVDHEAMMDMLDVELRMVKLSSVGERGGIRVLGIEGSLTESSRLAVIGGLTSSMIPSQPSGFRILSEREKLELGMEEVPSRRRQLEDLCIAMNAAEEVILSYHMEDDLRPVLPSPFIDGLSTEKAAMPEALLSRTDVLKRLGELNDPSLHLYETDSRRSIDLLNDAGSLLDLLDPYLSSSVRRGIDGRRMRWLEGEKGGGFRLMDEAMRGWLSARFGREHVWSASRLERYRECPYSFFARYILGLEEREDLRPVIPPDRKGLIFHSIAELFYTRWKERMGGRIDRLNLARAVGLMREAAEEVLSGYPYAGPFWDALTDLLLGTDGEKGLLDEFVELEAEYGGVFEVDECEVTFGPLAGGRSAPVTISLPGGTEEERFLFQGRIDRMDRFGAPGGDLLFIWDYKTGSGNQPKESLQVPLYISALGKVFPDDIGAGGGYYYVRNKGGLKKDPVMGGRIWNMERPDEDVIRSSLVEVSKMTSEAVNTSLEIIDSIRAGEFPVKERCSPRYCPYSDLCRIGDAG